MDQKGHRGQVLYHLARLGSASTEQFDVNGIREHLRALDAPPSLVDYVVEHARDEEGWNCPGATHDARVMRFLYPEKQ